MSLIQVTDLTFCYDGSFDDVFADVSFQFDSDWKTGLIGRNGRGKTTFLKLLMGEYPHRGQIHASVAFTYFPYPVHDRAQKTIAVLSRVSGGCPVWQLQRETGKLLVSPEALERPFETLSQGEQTKVLLAALFARENSFLLIDEPTNHLDREGRRALGNYLNTKSGFLLVSHDRDFLDHCVDHILAINQTNIELQAGNFSSWLQNKQLQDNLERSHQEQLKKETRELAQAARRTADWANRVEESKYGSKNSGLRPDRGYIGHKSAKMMKRSKGIEARRLAAMEEKAGLLKNLEEADDLKLYPQRYHTDRLVTLDQVSLFYGDRKVCEDISFEMNQGDRIAVCGKNGSGKSTLLKLICAEQIAYTGQFGKASNLRISYVSQDTSVLQGGLRDYVERRGIDESLFKAILRKLGFARVQFEKDLAQYSEGQKKKVLLAASLCEQAHLYVWDEPLNFVDVLSRMQMERLLLQYRPTILFVEHDGAFCDHVATKTVLLCAPQTVQQPVQKEE